MKSEDIKKLRQALNLSQEKFARELGVTTGTVLRWELGRTSPSPLAQEKLVRLAKKAVRDGVMSGRDIVS